MSSFGALVGGHQETGTSALEVLRELRDVLCAQKQVGSTVHTYGPHDGELLAFRRGADRALGQAITLIDLAIEKATPKAPQRDELKDYVDSLGVPRVMFWDWSPLRAWAYRG